MSDLAALLEAVREDAGAAATPADLAKILLGRLRGERDWTETVYPAVLEWVQQRERTRVREQEKQAFSGRKPERRLDYMNGDGTLSDGPPVATLVNPAEEARRRLLDDNCFVSDETGLVLWGDMTAALHRERIAYLEGRRRAFNAGIDASIARHREAADLLGSSGCATLREYAERNPGGELPPPPAH